MVKDKTGGLFRLAVGLMQAFATTNGDKNFASLVNNLAMYFQIRDDFINLADEEYFKSKSFCEDLTEGKFSYPIIHCIRKDLSDTRLISILKQRTEDVEVKRYAQGLMREAGSLKHTREKCRHLKMEIVEQIGSFGGNPPLLKVIEMLDVQLEGMEDEMQPQEAKSPRVTPRSGPQVDST
jgi:geranylgeranyl diphosphate synthase type 3